ncbi:zinc metalloproteinase-disintegrin-like daborhagin-K [Convolutriloba macropyga]|uniref:zinc metalloproteinase-disintegrin-like daborhagin-K n=1 Tax=Convolutriloba macropyga TaxID=536237 RepID=UPI003F51B096
MTASTLAHEIGHNFGLYHNSFHQESLFDNLNFDFFNYSDYNITDYEDYNVTGNDDYDNTDYEESDDYCLCDADYCIMDAYAHLVVPVAFSTCQQNQIKQFLTTGNSQCLHNEPTKNMDAPYCGDYIVNQEWEECDCGSGDRCEDICCDDVTCKLESWARCSAMDLCCDPTTCTIKASFCGLQFPLIFERTRV